LLPRSICRQLLCAAICIAVFPSSASEDSDADGPAPASAASAAETVERATGESNVLQPGRNATQSELQRLIDALTREKEELASRIGDDTPTAKQQTTLEDLSATLAYLQNQIEAKEQVTKERAAEAGNSFRGKWLRLMQASRDFTQYDIKDGMFRFRMGVRIQLDATAATESNQFESAFGSIDSSLDVRRARIFALGRLLRQLDFKFSYDFAVDAGFKDAFVEGANFTKYVKWRIGQFREPVSLARQTSAFNLGFIERPLPVPALTPGRNPGIMFRHLEINNRMFWAVSLTGNGRNTDDNRLNSDVSLAGRITGLPISRDGGRQLMHLGFSFSVQQNNGDEIDFAARPEARFAPFVVDTGTLNAQSATLLVGEFAYVTGPWWVQAEWMLNSVDAEDFGDPRFMGGYAEIGWFLTGESRSYLAENGAFGRLVPKQIFRRGNPFTRRGNGGAIEVVGRWSTLDLTDGLVRGGEVRDLGLAVNWYLTQASRVAVNYIHSNVADAGNADIFLLRYQFFP
jgi:phosphate-selective porin OprO/OprP